MHKTMKILTCSVKHLSKIDLQHKTVVVDVRSSPDNNPNWSRAELKRQLLARGIMYGHMPELGGWPDYAVRTPDGRIDYVKTAETAEFQAAVQRLIKGAEEYKLVLACWCTDPTDCHRRKLIGQALSVKGFEVRHLAHNDLPACPHWYDPAVDGFSLKPHAK